jgi:hypothetical protein
MCYRFDLFYYDYSTVFGTNRLFSIQYKATQYCTLLEIQLRPQSDGQKHLHNNLLIPQARPAHKCPISPWEMIKYPFGR